MTPMALLPPDELHERLLLSAERAYATFARRQVGMYTNYFAPGTCHGCQSPIEQVFYHAWLIAGALVHGSAFQIGLDPQHPVTVNGRCYRLDFALRFCATNPMHIGSAEYHNWHAMAWPKIAIELDGHDFHERTKEQVARRNERDRDLQLSGWTVLHFSGTEITRDPVGIALMVAGDAYSLGDQVFYQQRTVCA